MTSPTNPADILGPHGVLDAQERGRRAALAGDHPSTCPWKAPATERETALRAMWIRGYAQGRTEIREASGAADGPRQSPD